MPGVVGTSVPIAIMASAIATIKTGNRFMAAKVSNY